MKVLWIGLSSKDSKDGSTLLPLDKSTQSGKLISMIEDECTRFVFERTNLVFFTPKDSKGKLRYPNHQEMKESMPILEKKVKLFQPDIIFMLGNQVSQFIISEKKLTVTNKYNTKNTFELNQKIFIKLYHPSYISIYRRKHIPEFIGAISKTLEIISRHKTKIKVS